MLASPPSNSTYPSHTMLRLLHRMRPLSSRCSALRIARLLLLHLLEQVLERRVKELLLVRLQLEQRVPCTPSARHNRSVRTVVVVFSKQSRAFGKDERSWVARRPPSQWALPHDSMPHGLHGTSFSHGLRHSAAARAVMQPLPHAVTPPRSRAVTPPLPHRCHMPAVTRGRGAQLPCVSCFQFSRT